jgi:hypothetical protein
MRRINFFVEDSGHEVFLNALVERLADQYGIKVGINHYSVTGGCGRMIKELGDYLRDLERGQNSLPDLLIVARDANCKGLFGCRQEIDNKVPPRFKDFTIYAIPDPHIERWVLLDSAAFKLVLGKGCAAPDQKCERDRYKHFLIEAIRNAGISPLLGGIEHVEDIVKAMDLHRMEMADESLGRLLKDLHDKFKQWSREKSTLSG